MLKLAEDEVTRAEGCFCMVLEEVPLVVALIVVQDGWQAWTRIEATCGRLASCQGLACEFGPWEMPAWATAAARPASPESARGLGGATATRSHATPAAADTKESQLAMAHKCRCWKCPPNGTSVTQGAKAS